MVDAAPCTVVWASPDCSEAADSCVSLQDNHVCIENSMRQNCPVGAGTKSYACDPESPELRDLRGRASSPFLRWRAGGDCAATVLPRQILVHVEVKCLLPNF